MKISIIISHIYILASLYIYIYTINVFVVNIPEESIFFYRGSGPLALVSLLYCHSSFGMLLTLLKSALFYFLLFL